MPTRHLKLSVRPRSDVLQRVVGVCHRRRVEIVRLNYGLDEITLTFESCSPRSDGVQRWIGALVDVLDVHEIDAVEPVAPPPPDVSPIPAAGS